MSTTSKINRAQPTLCLLTTLLFLLCIYIKRVNSTATCNQATLTQLAPNNNALVLEHKLLRNRETYFELKCPVEMAIELKSQYKKTKRIKNLQEQLKNTSQVCGWTKDGLMLHRVNGNPILRTSDTSNNSFVFQMVGISDAGTYQCYIQFNNMTQEALRYFNIYPAIRFDLLVDDTNLPDILPAISHPPADQYVRLGDHATFTCKKVVTLLSPVTLWFKSTCLANETCTQKFLEAYNKTKETQDALHLANYIIADENSDEYSVPNVTEADIGYYGCLASNGKGQDIRRGSLRLFDTKSNDPTTTASSVDLNQLNSTTPANPLTRQQGSLKNAYQLDVSAGLGTAPSTERRADDKPIPMYVAVVTILFLLSYIVYLLHSNQQFPRKKDQNLLIHGPIVGQNCKEANIKQHLPDGGCPDIFGIGKTADGFITGHLQEAGHMMTQSICSGILNKEKNPSISSTNSNNSDEASSWGKSTKSDLSRNLYRHTSNDTTTTVPMYDHPPSANNAALCGVVVHDACVINPTYGVVRPDNDATDWIFPRRNLERLNKIGEGQFGEVWRYIARQKNGNENYVAVKQLKNRVGLGDRERLELVAEIEIMKSVNKHPNVIKLLNYCVDDHEPLLLIMEYAENGKLQTYLRNCRTTFRNPYGCLLGLEGPNYDVIPVTSKELIKFSYHIAKGMEYVASKGIIHRDLASRNILLSKEKVCKVADFGFARRITDECAYERTSANPVPVKWMAPEALVENKFTSKSDVFSLGILMWEIVTLGATPYENLSSPDVYKKVTAGGRLDRPPHCKDEFYRVMSSCWLQNPADRPTFKEIANQLEKLLLSDNDYIQLDQYPEHAYYNISYK